MTMTSRERVMTAFNHEEPDRVPRWCGASVEFWDKSKKELGLDDEALSVRFGDDFRRVYARYAGPDFPLSEDATSRTIFGVERIGLGYGQPTTHPLADATIKEIEEYAWPEPDWMDVSHVRDDALAHKGQYAILGGDWSPFWHDAIDLLGMENLYIKMCTEPELVDVLMQRMTDFYHEVSLRIFESAADAIDIFFVGNDYGSQTGPLLGVELFERFILPHQKRFIDLGHDYGLKVQLHCCGGIVQLIPSLIEVGLDGLHALQPDCQGMNPGEIKAAFGDKIVLNGAIDSHHVLINGTPESVREHTRDILKIMKPGGAYIAGASHDTILEETPVENILAMFDAVEEFGSYKC